LTSPSPGDSSQRSRLLLLAAGYAAAVILPWIGISLTLFTPALRGTPLALSYIFVAAITVAAGLRPGILAVVCTAVFFNHLALAHHRLFSLSPQSLAYSIVILVIGFFITVLCDRQRITGSRLRAALASLQIRTNSLMEAQQASNSAAWMHSVDEGRLYWAEGGAEIFGRAFSENEGDWTDTILDEDRARVLRAVEAATSIGKTFRVEFRVRWPNGEIHWLESRGTPSATNSRIWHGVTVDVTDRKNAELALVRSEKLAAIGRLSATIAHEVNNPLEAVTNLLYLAKSDPHLSPETSEYLERADEELSRLGAIARRTLTFVRPKSSSGPVDVLEVVESVSAMFQPRCTARSAEIRIVPADNLLLPIPSDDLRQVLTNLVSNACDALPDSGGVIEIDITRTSTTATLCVRDNGSGITPENAARVFDPFFTTKEDVGTGIGLWVTKDLVEKNGGRITVQTRDLPQPFRTMFCIELPIS
jgi:PAS domain S-box-containing protein